MSRGWVCCLAVSVLGCSAPVLSGGDDLRAEIRSLQQRVLELQRQAAVSEVELERLRRKVAELESSRGPASSGAAAEGAEPAPRIEGLSDEIPGSGREALSSPPEPPTRAA